MKTSKSAKRRPCPACGTRGANQIVDKDPEKPGRQRPIDHRRAAVQLQGNIPGGGQENDRPGLIARLGLHPPRLAPLVWADGAACPTSALTGGFP